MSNKVSMSVSNLVVEVTKRCNMCCAHCLRGEAQNSDMTLEMVDKIVNSFDEVSQVTFTGGEPTLNLKAIRRFFERAMEKWGSCPPFYIVTNGQENQFDLATLLLWAYANRDPYAEEYLYGVAISEDYFHENMGETSNNVLRALKFYDSSKEHSDTSERWVMKRGRAEEYGLGLSDRQPVPMPEVSVWTKDDGTVIANFDEVYISTEGYVVGDCDMSYADVAEEHVATIETLQDWVLTREDAE